MGNRCRWGVQITSGKIHGVYSACTLDIQSQPVDNLFAQHSNSFMATFSLGFALIHSWMPKTSFKI